MRRAAALIGRDRHGLYDPDRYLRLAGTDQSGAAGGQSVKGRGGSAPRGTGALGVRWPAGRAEGGGEMKLDLQTAALVAIAAALWVAVFEGFNAF